jgi:NADH-quinone oxidoreductase subunit G
MEEVAQDPVLDMRERGNLKEIIVSPGRQLEGHYTLMTEHVCPVGALTSKDFRFKARVWFLRSANSVCQGCATGCNSYLDYDPRYNKAYRYRPRDNERVNKYWMCDEGMLSYREAHENRVLEARVGRDTVTVPMALEKARAFFASVPADTVGVVLSARYSLEDNWALGQLGLVLMGSNNVYISGRPDGYEDAILIHKDKNPNTKGVQKLAPDAKGFQALLDDVKAGRVTHVIALGGAAPVDADGLDAAKVVTIAAHEGPLTRAATVVLPATSWAEHSGTYVNAKGLRQIADKALEPQGASQPAWKLVAELATALGYEASWSKVKQIRQLLTGGAEPGASTPPSASTTSAGGASAE